ncbi:class I SAM-dependent methyltransferase [Variovorax boronicumulans]
MKDVAIPVHASTTPSEWIVRWSHLLAPNATVLDVACGSGRHMQWFAGRGHAATGVDRAPEAVEAAGAFGRVVAADIESGPWPFAAQRFGAVVVTNYLWRPRMADIVAAVAPGGVLLYETFAAGNETVGKPSRPDFLLQPGELLGACASLQVIAYEDGFLPEPARFVQRIAAVRPGEAAAGAPPRHFLKAS